MKNNHPFVQRPAGPTLHPEDVTKFEARCHVTLPSDYRQFIMTTNGGMPSSSLFEQGSESLFIQFVFYIDPAGERGIDEELGIFPMHSGWLPVALEGTGGRIVLSTLDQSIYFVPSDQQYTASKFPQDSIIKLAANWSEFVDRCHGEDLVTEPEETLLEKLVRESDIETLHELHRTGFDMEAQNADGETMAQLATLKSNTKMLEALLQCGASLKGTLHKAAKFGMIPMINWLVEHGADLSERDADGKLPEEVEGLGFVSKYIKNKRQP